MRTDWRRHQEPCSIGALHPSRLCLCSLAALLCVCFGAVSVTSVPCLMSLSPSCQGASLRPSPNALISHCPPGVEGKGLRGSRPAMPLLQRCDSSLLRPARLGSLPWATPSWQRGKGTCWEERLGKPKGASAREGFTSRAWRDTELGPPGSQDLFALLLPLSPRMCRPSGAAGYKQGPTCGHTRCGAVHAPCTPWGCPGTGVPALPV